MVRARERDCPQVPTKGTAAAQSAKQRSTESRFEPDLKIAFIGCCKQFPI